MVNPALAKKSLLLLVILSLLIGTVAAYEISITAPESVQVGKPIVVNGTSNLHTGTTVEIVLSYSDNTYHEVARKSVTIQSVPDFSVTFDTKGLGSGVYKLEVLPVAGIQFLGNSTTLRSVQLVDRSGEIRITSPEKQEFDGMLRIEGSLANTQNTGVQVEVKDAAGTTIFGPEYIATTQAGAFSREVPITESGSYDVEFTDEKGFIGTVTFTVEELPQATTPVPTTAPTPVVPIVSATAEASQDNPAYFTVTTKGEPVQITTSTGIDWVIEYSDAAGNIQKVNRAGSATAEEITLPGTPETVYLKVYPYLYSASGQVTIMGENAKSIEVSATVPPVFSGTPGSTTSSAPQGPLPAYLPLLAIGIGIAVFVLFRKNRSSR
jgi:hypothetical protein